MATQDRLRNLVDGWIDDPPSLKNSLAVGTSIYIIYKIYRKYQRSRQLEQLYQDIPLNQGLDFKKVGPFTVQTFKDRYDLVTRLRKAGVHPESPVRGLTKAKFAPGEYLLIATTNEATEALYKSNVHLAKTVHETAMWKFLTGNVMIGMLPEPWRERRRKLNKSFHMSMVPGYLYAINNQCKEMVGILEREIGNSSEFEELPLRKRLSALTLDIAGEVLFGSSLDIQTTLQKTGKWPDWAETMVNVVMANLTYVFQQPLYWNFSWLYKLRERKRYNEWRAGEEKTLAFIADLVEKRREILKTSGDDVVADATSKKLCVIDCLIKLYEDGELSYRDMLDEIGIFIFAGFDTSSSAMGDGLVWMATRSDIQKKLHDEIESFFPENDFFVDQDVLSKMSYLDCVVREILRYCSPVPLHGRSTTKPLAFSNGFELRASEQFPVSITIIPDGMNFDEKYWGTDCGEFKPERHLDPTARANTMPTFSHGPRACIGKNLAMVTMKIELIYLFKKFDMHCNENATTLKDRPRSAELMIKFIDEPSVYFKVKE